MIKPIGDWTLLEVRAYCQKHECYSTVGNACILANTLCKSHSLGLPDMLRIEKAEKIRRSQNEQS